MPSDNGCAYLGMYDFPTLHPALDGWWSGLVGCFRSQGFSDVPERLTPQLSDPYDIWLAPNLFFAQTCGFPLTHRLEGKVRLVGTPCYDAPGCDGAMYSSLIIVRSDSDVENLSAALPARVAVNGMDSYSGWRALCGTVQSLGISIKSGSFSEIIMSGSHARSIDLVREGKADVAAIDCVTHALIGDTDPQRLAGTRILQQSASVPGLPYVTRADMGDADVQRMAEAIENAFSDPELADFRWVLRLAGFRKVPLQEYQRIMK